MHKRKLCRLEITSTSQLVSFVQYPLNLLWSWFGFGRRFHAVIITRALQSFSNNLYLTTGGLYRRFRTRAGR
ncbi:MAG: hypothetical protein AAB538_02685, partial [Patescibacteria group bacterium]